MAPAKPKKVTISQEAFNDLVNENIEDLGMEPDEALQDAIQTLTLQGVDLSGIITSPNNTSPLIQSLDSLKHFDSVNVDDIELDELLKSFDHLSQLCSSDSEEGLAKVAIAIRNGGVEVVCSICSKIPVDSDRALVSGLKALASLLRDLQSTDTFQKVDGPRIVVGIIRNGSQKLDILDSGFSVVAAASTGNEIVKASFMDLKIDELILQIMMEQKKGSIQCLYDAIRVLLTADDNRVVASEVYGYARRFAKLGIAGALVESLQGGLSSPGLVSASIALKAVAVNDEICRSIADNGGIDAILQCIDDGSEQGNRIVARGCCSLLSTLAGSDTNKNAIVAKSGLDRLIKLSSRFSEDPSVIQEVMSIICALCLRSPENAARAVEAGAGDLAIQAMQKFPGASQMQRNSCMMIRNLVVRNPENRTLLLNNGIEKIIRRTKETHESCKDAAAAALRDLGLDNYNA
ncbi:hypothetical protein RJ641_013694 [Dillenia turbinata]|uniref:Armadillo repeat-containing protein 6 n=1 Tax=Dillenia turbinata TaxID=194707 RepID=A0AAN8W6I0_9MAGN